MLIHAALVKNRSSSNDFPIQLIAWTKTVLIMISKLTRNLSMPPKESAGMS